MIVFLEIKADSGLMQDVRGRGGRETATCGWTPAGWIDGVGRWGRETGAGKERKGG